MKALQQMDPSHIRWCWLVVNNRALIPSSGSFFHFFVAPSLASPLLHLAFRKSWGKKAKQGGTLEEPWLSFSLTQTPNSSVFFHFTNKQISTNYISHSRSELLSCFSSSPALHCCSASLAAWLMSGSDQHQRLWQMSFSLTQLTKAR